VTIHILKYGNIGAWFCKTSFKNDTFVTPEQLKEIEHTIDVNVLCSTCVREASVWASAQLKAEEKVEERKEEEKPNRYTILNNEQGKWQILKRNVTNTFWQVEAKDLGSRSNAITLMDALIKRDREK
jgi:hypothetical protein